MARTRSAGVSNRPHHNHHQPIAGARLEIIMEGKRRAKLVPKGATAKKTVPRAVASKNRQAARKKATAAAVQAEEKEFTKAADRGAVSKLPLTFQHVLVLFSCSFVPATSRRPH